MFRLFKRKPMPRPKTYRAIDDKIEMRRLADLKLKERDARAAADLENLEHDLGTSTDTEYVVRAIERLRLEVRDAGLSIFDLLAFTKKD